MAHCVEDQAGIKLAGHVENKGISILHLRIYFE
jgi:hypothetical protein